MRDEATFRVKAGLAEMLKGGVIMDVVTPDQAKLAEDAGAAAVMALERVPADIRRDGGVARMSDPVMIRGIQEAVRHMRLITGELRRLKGLSDDELASAAKDLRAPFDLVREVAATGKLPVVLFCAGGIATPADAALMMQLGAEGVFVGSGIFKSADPARRAKAIVEATTHFRDAKLVAEVSRGLGEAMRGLSLEAIPAAERLAVRGW